MSDKKKIFFIFVIAFIIRLFFAHLGFLYPDLNAPGSDSARFEGIAQGLSRGEGFTAGGAAAVDRPPFYCFFLAAIYFVFGHSYYAVIIIQSLISAMACVFIFGAAKNIFDAKAAFRSYVISAGFPVFVALNNYLMSEPLSVFLLCAAVYFVSSYIKKFRLSSLVFSAVTFAALILNRPVFFILFIYTVFYIYVYNRKNVLHALFFLALAGLLVSGWVFRNYVVFKKFIPVTIYGGLNFYAATVLDESPFIPANQTLQDRLVGELPIPQAQISDAQFYGLAIANIRKRPLRYIGASFRRLLYFPFKSYAGALGLEKIQTGRRSLELFRNNKITLPFLARAGLILFYIIICMAALCACLRGRYGLSMDIKGYAAHFLFIYLFLVSFFSTGDSRFYVLAYPFVIIFGCSGFCDDLT